MALADAVPLYLTIVMVVLAVIAIVGGRNTDKKREKKD